jgi:hypothetical protein
MHNPYLLHRINCVASGTEHAVPEIHMVGTHLKSTDREGDQGTIWADQIW